MSLCFSLQSSRCLALRILKLEYKLGGEQKICGHFCFSIQNPNLLQAMCLFFFIIIDIYYRIGNLCVSKKYTKLM